MSRKKPFLVCLSLTRNLPLSHPIVSYRRAIIIFAFNIFICVLRLVMIRLLSYRPFVCHKMHQGALKHHYLFITILLSRASL